MLDMIFSIGTLISLLILAYGVYLSIVCSFMSETTRRPVGYLDAPNIIDLREASRDRRTDFTIGFRHRPASTARKLAA